jgi:hypothetical protein
MAAAFARVNVISCTALAPASRKCAPATEIALNLGTSAAQNSMVSAISRSDGSGGQIQAPPGCVAAALPEHRGVSSSCSRSRHRTLLM